MDMNYYQERRVYSPERNPTIQRIHNLRTMNILFRLFGVDITYSG